MRSVPEDDRELCNPGKCSCAYDLVPLRLPTAAGGPHS